MKPEHLCTWLVHLLWSILSLSHSQLEHKSGWAGQSLGKGHWQATAQSVHLHAQWCEGWWKVWGTESSRWLMRMRVIFYFLHPKILSASLTCGKHIFGNIFQVSSPFKPLSCTVLGWPQNFFRFSLYRLMEKTRMNSAPNIFSVPLLKKLIEAELLGSVIFVLKYFIAVLDCTLLWLLLKHCLNSLSFKYNHEEVS